MLSNTPNYAPSKLTVFPLPTIDVVDPLAASTNNDRTTQQMLIPTSVKARLLGDVTSDTTPLITDTPLTSQLLIIPTGKSGSFLFTIADASNRAIIAIPEIDVYTDEVSIPARWPNPTYHMITLPVNVYNDRSISDQKNIVTRVTVGNNTGSTQNIIATCSWRVLTQPNQQFNPANVTISVQSIAL